MARTNRLRYILFYKPFGVLSQFTHEAGRESLMDYGPFPNDVYPVGRLDADSVKHRLTEPAFNHPRVYLVQVERIPSEDALRKLSTGVIVDGKETKPAEVRLLDDDPPLPPRPIPIRYRKTVPTAWIEITLREGRNRQVRKMTAAVGHPTLRLVRTHIANLTAEGLQPGTSRQLMPREVAELQSYLGLLSRDPLRQK
jgi:23S rRNA pseudouridine2457 synthase